ncbi:MAG: PH domain-containing protein [Candidatus Hodarchaeota archaeon]
MKEKRLVQAKSRVLNPDEELICVIKGRLSSRGGRRVASLSPRARSRKTLELPPSGLLFITDKRIIFYLKVLLGRYQQIIFQYEHINSVYGGKGITGDKIDIKALTDNVSIDYIPKGDGTIALDYINEHIEEFKTQKVEVVRGGTPTVDIIEQIEKLGQLREKGLITEEEFERKKTELLEKL